MDRKRREIHRGGEQQDKNRAMGSEKNPERLREPWGGKRAPERTGERGDTKDGLGRMDKLR